MTPAAALPAHSERPAAARIASVTGLATRPARFAATVESIGHLVPQSSWSGRVHSVFARACNVACGERLLTIGTRAVGDGPTTLVLARDIGDLRDRFAIGERVEARDRRIFSARVALDLASARVWRAAERGPLLSAAAIEARVRRARACIAQRRATQPNILDREATGIAKTLLDACAALDSARARAQLDRLIGWGEGLTPAGDDFIVGLLAGLDALARNARVDRVLAALCCSDDERDVDVALHDLLSLGATSGADTASGIVAALHAWSPASAFAEAA